RKDGPPHEPERGCVRSTSRSALWPEHVEHCQCVASGCRRVGSSDTVALRPCLSVQESKAQACWVNSFRQETARRRLHWRVAHYWSRVRLHKKLVLAAVLLGAVVGLSATLATPPVYMSQTRLGFTVCPHGQFLWGCDHPCSPCVEEATPLLVKWARGLDRTGATIGWTNLNLASWAAQLFE